VNVALQCLRYTPTLEQAIISDLLSHPAAHHQEATNLAEATENGTDARSSFERSSGSPELQSVPESGILADAYLQTSSPSTSLNASGQTHDTVPPSAEADSTLGGLPPQHSMYSVIPQSQNQLPVTQHLHTNGNQQHQGSQPVGIPASHHSMPSHSRASSVEQLPGQSPEQLPETLPSLSSSGNGSGFSPQTTSISESPVGLSGDASTSDSAALATGQLTDQQAQLAGSAQQAAGSASQAASGAPEGDDSAKAPPNESTAAQQPRPVTVPRVPLKRGEIAESFKTLVKQVSKWQHVNASWLVLSLLELFFQSRR